MVFKMFFLWEFVGFTGFKSSQGLLFSEAKETYAETVGQTGAQGPLRGVWSPLPPELSKESGER